ncbi:hypothetical protein BFN03_07280 [Rhodococcus sp. WMMA185]|uniref:B-4DMT family transporter n=1 Tax=Rhodococcus sp. WMMA185 TaxID=679318 RepID=UPI0008784220|nr:B-4DMT family transporter [Rhodococcus sp. WMMA185]AOW92572.1 hypothetical protein BFN03_07280 [Rhodococcus sp. WMMA185]
MNAWVVRGLGMALIHVLVRVILGVSITQWPLLGSPLRWISLVIVVVAALVWAGLDGIRDRRENPNPADGEDLTMLWLKAALLGGVVAGLASWLADLLPFLNVTQNSFFFELTSGAAFTVLLIFGPAMLAVFLGRFFVSREAAKSASEGGSLPAVAGPGEQADEQFGDAQVQDTQIQDTDYAGSDDDTTVFERIHEYREDTSDLDDHPEDEGTGRDHTDQSDHPADGRSRSE